MCVKIREIHNLYSDSAVMDTNVNKSTCAVCFEFKDERTKTLHKKTKGIEAKIQSYIWPSYNLGKSVCPSVICSNCRRNLFCLEKDSTEYLSNWMQKGIVKSIKTSIYKQLLCI